MCSQALPLEHPELFSQFAFLIAGYREEHLNWEFYVVVRKLGLLIIASAAPPSTMLGLRSFVSAAIVVIAMALQIQHKPYRRDDINRVELAALATGVVSLLCAQYLTVLDGRPGDHDVQSGAATVLAMLANGALIVLVLSYAVAPARGAIVALIQTAMDVLNPCY